MRFAVANVCGQQFLACAKTDFDSAEFETHIDATDCDVESDVVIADLIVEVYCSVIFAVFVLDVTEQTRSQFFDLSFFAVIADISVVFDVCVGDAFNAVRSSVHSVTAQTYGVGDVFDFRIVVCVGMDVLALNFVFNHDVFAVFEHCVGLARFQVAVLEFVFYAVNEGDACAVNLRFVNVSRVCKIVFVACDVVSVGARFLAEIFRCVLRVSVAFVLVLEFFVQVGIGRFQIFHALVNGLTEINAQRDVEHVEYVFERAEIGHKRCKHECDQRFCDLDLELRIAVCEQQDRVALARASLRFVACRLRAVFFFIATDRTEFVGDFLCKFHEVFDLGIVFRSGNDAREVEIERTAAQIHTAEHFFVAVADVVCSVVFCEVALVVHFDELDCEFDFAQIAVIDEVAERAAGRKSLQIECRKVDVCGNSQTDTRVESVERLQVDDHIAERIGKQAARVDDFRACGIEVNQAAYAQRYILILVCGLSALVVEFDLACKSVASDFVAVRVFFGDGNRHIHSRIERVAFGCGSIVLVDVNVVFGVVDVCAVGIDVVFDDICVLLAVLARLYGCVRARIHLNVGEVFFCVTLRAFGQRFAVVYESVFAVFAENVSAVCVNREVGLAVHTRLEQVFAVVARLERIVDCVVGEIRRSLIILAAETAQKFDDVFDVVVKRDEFEFLVVVEKRLIVCIYAYETDFRIESEIEVDEILRF